MARKTDYAQIASAFDRRYQDHRYEGTEQTLRSFVDAGQRVLEVGCGTGHWLQLLEQWGCDVSGLDPSSQMLEKAAARGLRAELVHGHAESLPFSAASFDRVLCINAIHHFEDIPRFIGEARRVLRAGGRLLSIALDPSQGRDRWAIYDYFAPTLELDRKRYPATSLLRTWLADSGFTQCETLVAQRILSEHGARETLATDRLAQSSTSQLAILSDDEYAAGIAAIRADLAAAEARGSNLRLISDLHLYATFGSVP